MREPNEQVCEGLLELTHRQKSEASRVGEARERRDWFLASALTNFPLCHYSHWPGLRVWLTFCVQSTSAATCAETVWRRRRRSFPPNEPGNININFLDSQLTRDSNIQPSSKYQTRPKMQQFCERSHVLLKPERFLWSAISTDIILQME